VVTENSVDLLDGYVKSVDMLDVYDKTKFHFSRMHDVFKV